MEKTLKERTKLLANKKLCYGCYQPITSNHNFKTCKQRLLCRICKEYHPTGIHDCVKKFFEENTESEDRTKDTVKLATVKGEFDTEVISMCVVPIWVGHRNSRKLIKKHAVLGNCSQESFIKDEIIKDLGTLGRKLKLSFERLIYEKSEDTEAVDGLIISAVDSKKRKPMEWLKLSKAYSNNCLPVEKEEIAKPDTSI